MKYRKILLAYNGSQEGKRALFEARGNVFTVPAESGLVRDLTKTSGSAERYPQWSPDGAQVTYRTNAHGSWEIVVEDLANRGSTFLPTAASPPPPSDLPEVAPIEAADVALEAADRAYLLDVLTSNSRPVRPRSAICTTRWPPE